MTTSRTKAQLVKASLNIGKQTQINKTELDNMLSSAIRFNAMLGVCNIDMLILSTLENMQKLPPNANLKAPGNAHYVESLKEYVYYLMGYINQCILAYAANQEHGFQKDVYGYWDNETKYSRTEIKNKFRYAHYIPELISQWKEENRVNPEKLAEGELISPVEAAELVASDEEVLEATLNDGSTIIIDRPNNRVGAMGNDGKMIWVKSKINLIKEKLVALKNWIAHWGGKILNWIKEYYGKAKEWFFGDDEEEPVKVEKKESAEQAVVATNTKQ